MNQKIICVSENGVKTEISNNFPFLLEEITGIFETVGEIAKVKSAFGTGTKYVGTSINDRTIQILGTCRKGYANRTRLYNAFPKKQWGTLYYYEDDMIRKINYQVEDVKIANNYSHNYFQIDLLCPNPYFTDVNETIVSLANWKKMFEFPFENEVGETFEFGTKELSLLATIENDSNIEIGMRIVFNANGEVRNPSVTNIITGETLKLNETIDVGEKIEVSTYLNEKNIYVTKDNITERKNNTLVFGSKFLQIHPGKNQFKFDAEYKSENLELEFYYFKNYEAV